MENNAIEHRDTAAAAAAVNSRAIRSLLGFPLFYKILIANAVIVALVTAASLLLAREAGTDPIGFAFLLGGGLVLSVISNAVILRLALSPLRRLEQTAARVRAGDLTARVETSHLADRNLERLAATFNMMLDSAQAYRARLRDVAARALNAQEEERKRIARELHDGIAQTLAALRVQLRIARSAPEAARLDAVDRVSVAMGDATEEVRRIAQGLRPPALDMLGLSPAIESCARSIVATTGMRIDTDLAATDGLLTPEAELALYRIVQEALSNAARHSDAACARVELDVVRGHVQVVVSDDGLGFAVDDEMARDGLGLFGMQERGAYVGGTVDIDSRPGSGTRVRVSIPVVEAARYA